MNQKKFHRVYADGCYDICHFGHYNFVRQAAELGEELIAGVHNDDVIQKNKGPVVFNLSERMMMIEACKWVTKAVPNAPYYVTVEWLDELDCDVSIHGDDMVVTDDGRNCYQPVIDAGRFQTVPRTKSISTTNLIGRMLRLPKSELPENFDKSTICEFAGDINSLVTYIPTTHRIAQFSNKNEPKPNDRIVYCDGTFDLLHPGHISFLKKAKELGDYLIVGVHDDSTIAGKRNPIMTLQERVLNVLSMKYVDDVIIGAPYVITKELINQIDPYVVVEGSSPEKSDHETVDPYKLPKDLGIFKKIESDYPDFTSKTVINRIFNQYTAYAKRNAVKEASPFESYNK